MIHACPQLYQSLMASSEGPVHLRLLAREGQCLETVLMQLSMSSCRYGSAGEIKVKLGENKGDTGGNDNEDPFADLILATRQKVSSQADLPRTCNPINDGALCRYTAHMAACHGIIPAYLGRSLQPLC